MPFDGTSPSPSLQVLSQVLRGGPEHPLWPEGFEWNYANCTTCAMGLAHRLWSQVISYNSFLRLFICQPDEQIAPVFDMNQEAALRIFAKLSAHLNIGSEKITPLHVADALDQYLAQQSEPAPTFEAVTGR